MPKASGKTEPLSATELKSACWYTVAKIAEDEESELGLTVSEQTVAAVAELVFQQAQTLGRDLEAFAHHAGRTGIEIDDVKLAARQNPALYTQLETATRKNFALADLKLKTALPKAKPKAQRMPAKKRPGTTLIDPSAEKSAAGATKGKGKKKQVAIEDSEDTSD